MGNTKIEKIIATAINEAQKSPMIFRLGAVIVHQNKIISTGYNKPICFNKTSNFYNKYSIHAEMSALKSLDIKKKNCDLYVVRILKNNSLAESKPCLDCQKSLQKAMQKGNIRKVVYIN